MMNFEYRYFIFYEVTITKKQVVGEYDILQNTVHKHH